MGRYGAVDIYLPELHLLIQIDGEQHYRNAEHSEDVKQQIARDRRFLFGALHKGFSVLRVAARDLDNFADLVDLILDKAAGHSGPHALLSLHSSIAMGLPTDMCGFVKGKHSNLPCMVPCHA